MGDEAHVGLVDAHAEGDGRGNHHLFGLDERRLVARADLRLEPGVIGQRRPAARGQLLGDPLGLVAARRVDDPAPGCCASSVLQLLAESVARPDVVADVRAGRTRR